VLRSRGVSKYILKYIVIVCAVGLGSAIPLANTHIMIQNQPTETTFSNQNSFVEAVVSKNVDGDTIHIKINNKDYPLRLIGVNSPEYMKPDSPVEYYGKEASEFTKSKLMIGRKIWLENDSSITDKYDRLLKYVWLEKPEQANESEIRTKMFNAILVLKGYAKVMTILPDAKYSDCFIKFEKEAHSENKGLWNIK